jgi:hypothetical protein
MTWDESYSRWVRGREERRPHDLQTVARESQQRAANPAPGRGRAYADQVDYLPARVDSTTLVLEPSPNDL